MIHTGDSIEILKTLHENSVDAVVTDPPAGISFMGKSWDDDKGGRDEWITWLADVMRECHRVLKPGGHGLVWAIPRTSHWTGMALEQAGFEIRDCITHLFGSGFPKSLDVSKAIDKAAGAEREVIGPNKFAHLNGKANANCYGEAKRADETAPSTDAAKQWQGWGTALKPAAEFWWLVRKPLSEKTVAANVLEWGTGGLNIDGGRIFGGGKKGEGGRLKGATGSFSQFNTGNHNPVNDSTGRFPANLLISHTEYCTDDQCDIECAIRMLDEQSGVSKGGKRGREVVPMWGLKDNGSGLSTAPRDRSDSGGASRFFYCAKVSPSERGKDNRHPTVKPLKLMRYLCRLVTPPGGTILDPFLGSGSTGVAAIQEGFEFIGIEREPEYVAIAEKRIASVTQTYITHNAPSNCVEVVNGDR